MISINEKQIQQIINLLHEEYRDCKVQIINSKKVLLKLKIIEFLKLKKFEYEHYRGILSKKVDGNYNSMLRISQVYRFNLDKDGRDLYSVFVLYHELRHHYQNKHNRLRRHDIEKDCHRFAWKMFNRHFDDIKRILNN